MTIFIHTHHTRARTHAHTHISATTYTHHTRTRKHAHIFSARDFNFFPFFLFNPHQVSKCACRSKLLVVQCFILFQCALFKLQQRPLGVSIFSSICLHKSPLNRGIAATPLTCLSREKYATHFTPFKWWSVSCTYIYIYIFNSMLVPCLCVCCKCSLLELTHLY